jgi:Tfp pilus assembly protein PilP
MRLAMISKVLLLSLSAVLTTGLAAQEHPNINPSTVRGELQQAGQAPRAPAKAQAPAKAPAAQRPARGRVERPEAAPVARRDPFEALVNKAQPGTGEPANLPPGKAGLVVNSLRVDGIVKGPNGMIAVVSNPQQRVYFLREGDKLYDGSVERITLEAVSFHEVGKDAFGKPIERQVTKRLYPSPGEQP